MNKINDMEELQQYRAIGTVEDIREVMALCKSLQETVCKYMDIGNIEEFKALKEKNEPKKVIRKKDLSLSRINGETKAMKL